MVAVFLGFATETSTLIKMLGFGLGVAILLDATVVRLVLVPATMSLLGERNWWTPAWLDRRAPAPRRGGSERCRGGPLRDERVPRSSSEAARVSPVRICVLGACRVIDQEGAEVELGSRKPRSIVAALALPRADRSSVDTLADLVWGGDPPRTAQGSLHAYLSGLRSALEPERPPAERPR